MERLVCKICGKVFTYEKLSACRTRFTVHLKKDHNMDKETYLVKYELNGVHPTCACGCGEKVHLNSDGWEFNRYVADSHVGKVHSEEAQRIKDDMVKARKKV